MAAHAPEEEPAPPEEEPAPPITIEGGIELLASHPTATHAVLAMQAEMEGGGDNASVSAFTNMCFGANVTSPAGHTRGQTLYDERLNLAIEVALEIVDDHQPKHKSRATRSALNTAFAAGSSERLKQATAEVVEMMKADSELQRVADHNKAKHAMEAMQRNAKQADDERLKKQASLDLTGREVAGDLINRAHNGDCLLEKGQIQAVQREFLQTGTTRLRADLKLSVETNSNGSVATKMECAFCAEKSETRRICACLPADPHSAQFHLMRGTVRGA